jgi:hypothetical protein
MPQWVHTIRGPNMKEEDMRIRNVLIGKLVASLCLMIAITSGFAGEKQKYHFMVLSDAANGKEDTYLKWYERQHIHDLFSNPGLRRSSILQAFRHSIRRRTAAALPDGMGNRD